MNMGTTVTVYCFEVIRVTEVKDSKRPFKTYWYRLPSNSTKG